MEQIKNEIGRLINKGFATQDERNDLITKCENQ